MGVYDIGGMPTILSDKLSKIYRLLHCIVNKPKVINQALDNIIARYGITRCDILTFINPELNWVVIE